MFPRGGGRGGWSQTRNGKKTKLRRADNVPCLYQEKRNIKGDFHWRTKEKESMGNGEGPEPSKIRSAWRLLER